MYPGTHIYRFDTHVLLCNFQEVFNSVKGKVAKAASEAGHHRETTRITAEPLQEQLISFTTQTEKQKSAFVKQLELQVKFVP